MNQLYQITAPHFVAVFEYDTVDKVVFRSAPIIKYLNRWQFKDIAEYCNRKCWKLELVPLTGKEE